MSDRNESTLEYYNNIRESDYVLCLRGGGNYSRRLYETLFNLQYERPGEKYILLRL